MDGEEEGGEGSRMDGEERRGREREGVIFERERTTLLLFIPSAIFFSASSSDSPY